MHAGGQGRGPLAGHLLSVVCLSWLRYSLPPPLMARRMVGTPISTMASVHRAAATENCITLDQHVTDLPF
jgi:hypothetical protein